MNGHRAHHPREVEDLNEIGGHCPRCGTEYRPGFHVCADCNVPLLPGPAPVQRSEAAPSGSGREASPGDGRVEIATVCSLPFEEAWLMAGRLRTEGINARVYPEDYTMSTYGLSRQRTFDVIVPAADLHAAREVVAAFTTP